MNPKVDAFLAREKAWKEEFTLLRTLLLGCGLVEELKWGQPCYTQDGKNVVLMHGFKEYCALLFMKGALMKDPKSILIQQTEQVQAARQIRFTSAAEVEKRAKAITAYVKEAMAIEKAGLKVELKKTADYAVPEELARRLDGDRALREAFSALTPGRQRAYLYHISQAKQSSTREARVEKCVPRILDGLGLDD